MIKKITISEFMMLSEEDSKAYLKSFKVENELKKDCRICGAYPCDIGMKKYDREYNALLDASIHQNGCPDFKPEEGKS